MRGRFSFDNPLATLRNWCTWFFCTETKSWLIASECFKNVICRSGMMRFHCDVTAHPKNCPTVSPQQKNVTLWAFILIFPFEIFSRLYYTNRNFLETCVCVKLKTIFLSYFIWDSIFIFIVWAHPVQSHFLTVRECTADIFLEDFQSLDIWINSIHRSTDYSRFNSILD